MQVMRLAVVGLGFMGAVHLKALRSIPGAQLAAVVSRDGSKLSGDLGTVGGNIAGSGERFDFSAVRKYRDLSAALRDPEIDAVDVCLPTDLHESAALESLRAGKHVLLEKPLALNVAACETIIEEARRQGRVLMVAQVLRFFPAYRAAASSLGELGDLKSATFRRRCARPSWADWQADSSRSGGAVLDLLIHDLDFALHLFGAPESVAATGRVEQDVDIISAQLAYSGGFAVDVTGGWHPGKYPITMKYHVTGSRGMIEYDFNKHPPRLMRDGGSIDVPLGSADGYAREIEYFIECARTGREPEQCRPRDSAEAVRLALHIIESRNRSGERIPWKSV